MYSSIFGGITTDPAAMVIPIDDHIVHRGHGVFDTAAIMDGLAYDFYTLILCFLCIACLLDLNYMLLSKRLANLMLNLLYVSAFCYGRLVETMQAFGMCSFFLCLVEF